MLKLFKLEGLQKRTGLIFILLVTAAYAAVFFPIHHFVGNTAAELTILPVAAAGLLRGLRMGLLAALLFIPLNIALVILAGGNGFRDVMEHWPGVVSSVAAGTVTGWMSGLLRQARLQAKKIGLEHESLKEEIAKRGRREEKLVEAQDELERRADERTVELVAAIEALQAEINEHNRTEAALQESEDRYRIVVEKMTDGLAIRNADGMFTYVNDSLCRLLGHSRNELLGRPVTDFLDEENQILLREQTIALEKGARKSSEIAWTAKSGKKISTIVSPAPILDAAGALQGNFAVITDITRRKQMEEDLFRAQKLESVVMLAGGIAHDFNNLLTSILNNLELAKMHAVQESKLYDRLVEAENSAIKAKSVVQHLLAFSHSGGAPVKKSALIGELIKASAGFALRGSRSQCEFFIPDDLWPVEADEGQLSQVVHNLITNADHAMPKGGTIKVYCENTVIYDHDDSPLKQGRYVKVTVEDHGIGIPKEHVHKIFDPYFTTKPRRSGLGLATSYSIIRKHGGYITVESESGIGTTISFYLPASEETPMDTDGGTEFVPGSGRILIMDHEDTVRYTTGEVLKEIGYEVEFAGDGAEAVELYRKAREAGTPFHVVIMDLTVPGGMGGREAVKKLLEADPGAKAIVASGYSSDPVMVDCKKYGFQGAIKKPFKLREMSVLVQKVMATTPEFDRKKNSARPE